MLTELNLQPRHCTLCGPGEPKKVLYPARFEEFDLKAAAFSARNIPKRVHFRIVKCLGCGILYSDPALDGKALGSLYTETTVNYDALEDQIYDSYVPILDRAMQRLSRRECFVEIGGGRGFMLKYAIAKGFESAIEVEPSLSAAARCAIENPAIRFITESFKSGIIENDTTDLVCFFQMLDHVADPLKFLTEIYSSLRKGGVAVCVVHNTRALSARALGRHSPIFGLWHPYLFHPGNLKRLFEKAGFTRLEAFPIPNRYALWYWLHELPLPESIKQKLGRALNALKLSQRRANLYAGNFALIASRPE